MTETPNDAQQDDTPPYFKSWQSIYLIVVANIFLIIVFLYLFFS